MNVLEEIREEFKKMGMYENRAKLSAVSDSIVVFHVYETSGSFHELCIITDAPNFWSTMTVEEVLECKDILFLSHRYFGKNDPIANDEFTLISEGKTFRADNDTDNLISEEDAFKTAQRKPKGENIITAYELLKGAAAASKRLKAAFHTYLCFDSTRIGEFGNPFDGELNKKLKVEIDNLTEIAFKELWGTVPDWKK